MDRLQPLTRIHVTIAVAIAATTFAGCDDGPAADVPPPSRVVSVAPRNVEAEPFCDAIRGEPRAFQMPELAEPAPARSGNGTRWINVWATWCRPCVEEIPMLLGWKDRLRRDGAPVDLVFLSVDGNAEDVTRFRGTHPDFPASARIASTDALPAWLTSIGLDEGATIPIQILVDGSDRIRCVRSGPVSESDYAAAKAVVRGE